MNAACSTSLSVKETFSTIASDYDRMNSVLSFGLHHRWNRELVRAVKRANHLLDLCAGTGEIAFKFLEQNSDSCTVLLDFCPQMLSVAKKKGAHLEPRFLIEEGDAQKLPFDDGAFDAATIAYGIRNVKDPMRCFQETYRILQRGGRFAILELTRPSGIMALGHKLHLAMVPLLGKLVVKKPLPYRYLKRTIESFASPEELMEQLSEVGFVHVHKKSLLGGTATLISAQKC
ncbi:MAG: Demethylmenaquinone methyltransferase [Chlamydiales bacterium]|nr:Demethylmenaquinone methyltransferase [Chlamydiales bacterium]MCH9635833.1 Demethylmenaquinone methyltransferase [Chlamydiales bacterium]MCH9704145.1 ubiquinone/menaquinone biosynthesis methyltransferase [Chlamydiota bacterium]